jgi:hypothetical protein
VPRIRVSSAALLLLGLTALALLLRVANLDDVFTPKGVVFVEFDPYYHMWRVFQTLGHYPWVPLFDPSMNTPHGAAVIWPPLFDLFLATVCVALGLGPQDAEGVEKVASVVVPVLGALTVVALYAFARRIFGRTHALLACAVLATLPAHVWYSRLGFVDHHVAVTLVQVLLFHSLLRALAAGSEDAPPRAALPWTAAAAACLTVGFLVWNGFLFFAFLLDLCLLALLLLERNHPRSSVWRFALVTHVAAALLITPFVVATVRVTGRAFSPLTLSWLPVAALLAFALLGGLEGLRRSPRLASWPAWLRWTLLTAPVAGIAAIFVHQSRNLALGFQWLTASDRFMASVAESGSSLFTSGVFNLEQPQIWLTRFYLAAPVPLALLGLDLHRRGWRDRGRTVVLIWGTVLFAMSLVQRRFGEPFAPVLAMLAADVLMRVHGWVARLLRPDDAPGDRAPEEEGKKAGTPADAWSEGASQAAAWAAVAATVVLAYLPSAPGFFLALGKDGEYSRQTFEDLKRFEALLHSRFGPAVRGVPRPQGMLGPWDMGHRILYITGSPVVANNFGLHIGEDSFREPASFLLETDEARAVAALDRRKVSFVLTDWELSFAQQLVEHLGADPKPFFMPLPGPEAGTMMTPAFTQTLYFRMGSSYAGSQGLANYPGGQAVPIAALERFRLVQETSVAQPLRRLRIYERVQGARLQVTGAPGSVLRLRYAFRTPQGKEFVHRREVPVTGGAVEIRLPYSSERPEYGHTARYMIRAENGTEAGLLVPEASVVQGQVVSLTWMPPQAAGQRPPPASRPPVPPSPRLP